MKYHWFKPLSHTNKYLITAKKTILANKMTMGKNCFLLEKKIKENFRCQIYCFNNKWYECTYDEYNCFRYKTKRFSLCT